MSIYSYFLKIDEQYRKSWTKDMEDLPIKAKRGRHLCGVYKTQSNAQVNSNLNFNKNL